MLKNKKFLIFSGAITTAALIFLWKTKQSTAARIDHNNLDSVKTINLIGDSQTKRHLGQAYQNVFSQDGVTVNFFGKEGATHEDYLKNTELMESVKALGCSDIVLIQLGDNGISNRTDKVKEFIEIIRQECPNAKVYWAGPMKAVKPSIRSSYVNTTDPSSPRYITNYNRMRKTWDERLKTALEDTGVKHISNFDLQESQPLNSSFSDNRKGDGIHLTEDSANTLAQLTSSIIKEDYNG
mgnify:CR=1 FL=1|tara:strand:+ start:29 stop:745 length:717 start_codon:yes stop_codon:yes gene_type:complete